MTRDADDRDVERLPDFPAARRHVLVELTRFVRVLRRDGVDVPPTGSLEAARALAIVGLGDRNAADAALRASLLSSPADGDAFEEAFPKFWHRLRTGLDRIATVGAGSTPGRGGEDANDARIEPDVDAASTEPESSDEPARLPDAKPPEADDGEGTIDEEAVRIPTSRRYAAGDREATDGDADAARYSAVGGSHRVEPVYGVLSAAERTAIDRFVGSLASLPGRRRQRTPRGDGVDARSALRASLSTGGAPIDLPRIAPVESELRCCLLVDVSGSVLDTLDRAALLALGDHVVRTAFDARVFLFDTDLAEVTDAFTRSNGDPAAALNEREVEWGGGTRIGHALETLRRVDPYAVDRRTVVIVVSDGLDVGEPDLLAEGITWLANRSAAIVWLNPLAVSPAFEPTARGMSTAMPYVDALFGFSRASDLDDAATQLERHGVGGPVGYEHARRSGTGAIGGERP